MFIDRWLAFLLLAAGSAGAQDGASAAIRIAADSSSELRVLVSLGERRMRVVDARNDTLRVITVATGSGTTLRWGRQSWTFRTPIGIATVVGREAEPRWIAPDWHYIEVARDHGYAMVRLEYGRAIELPTGRKILIRNDTAGVLAHDSTFAPFDVGDIVRDNTLYVPPLGTVNRSYPDVLGRFRLQLDNGVGIHGTNDASSIGKAVTHGCIRLTDDDIAWLYDVVPLGTRVYIY